MKKLLAVIAASLALLVPAVSGAEDTLMIFKEPRTLRINGLALTSARWTGWINVSKRRTATIDIAFTYSAATAVTMRCETSDSSATANDSGFDLPVLAASATAGTSDSTVHTWSNATAASESWSWTVSNLPHDYVNCQISGSGAPAAGDTIIVYSKAATP